MNRVWREALRFAISGILGFLVDATVLYTALMFGLGSYSGRVVSFLSAVWVTWQLNRHFTFQTRSGFSVWREWWQYLLAMMGGGAVNYACYGAVIHFFGSRALIPLAAVAIGSLAGMAVNFISARFWVFKRGQ